MIQLLHLSCLGYAVTPDVKSYATAIFHKEKYKSIVTKI